MMLDEEGFEYAVKPSEVLIVDQDIDKRLSGETKKRPSIKVKPRKSTKKVKSQPNQGARMVIDLHIERIHPNYAQLEKWDILNRQLGYLRAQLQKIKAKKIKQVVIVHGVGEGKLKREVHQILNGMKGVQYHEASYVEFGQGATAVEFN